MTRSRPLRRPLRRAWRGAVVVPLALAVVAGCDDDDDAETIESDVRAEITQASAELEDEITEASAELEDEITDVSEALEEGEEAVEEGAEAVEDAAAEAAELAARNLAAQQGATEFEDAGHPLDGGLDCTATVADGVDTIDIDCTGTTEDGGDAELTGTTDEIPGLSVTELSGEFTGTVDGDEVFTVDALG